MIELKVNAYTDRERMVTSLINSGYTVKVVEKPDPKRYLGKYYYIQILDGDVNVINNFYVNIDLINDEKLKSKEFVENLMEKIKVIGQSK